MFHNIMGIWICSMFSEPRECLSFATKEIECCQRQNIVQISSGRSITAPHLNIFVQKYVYIQKVTLETA